MIRKTTYRSFLLLLGLAVLYILIFPARLGRELVPVPHWKTEVAEPSASAVPGADRETAFPFRLRDRFGYLDPAGRLAYADTVLFDVALDSGRFVNFSRILQTVATHDSGGRLLDAFPAAGYPVLRSGRLLQLTSDRSGLSEWDSGGGMLWRRSFSTVITDLRVTREAVLVGLLEGRLLLLDRQGRVTLDFAPGGSRIQAVYGCAVSPDGERIGILSGLDPQRLVLLERRQENWKPVYQESLAGEFRRRSFIDFSRDGGYLLWEGKGALEILDTESFVRQNVDYEGSLLSAVAGDRSGTAAVLTSENPGMLGFRLLSFPDTPYFRVRFPGSSVFIRNDSGAYFLGVDDRVVRFDLEES